MNPILKALLKSKYILVWDSWNNWTECDVSCGGGKQKRSRNCKNGSPGDSGCLGKAVDTLDCNTQSCPAGITNCL